MKFTEVRTLEHLLKEVGTQGTQGTQGTEPTVKQLAEPKQQTVKDIKKGSVVVGSDGKKAVVVSPVGDGELIDAMVTQREDGEYEVVDQKQNVDVYDPEELDGDPAGAKDLVKGFGSDLKKNFSKGQEFGKFLTAGKLSKIAKRKGKKLKLKSLKNKIKRLARSNLKEVDSKLFEINFNRQTMKDALELPIRCGFEAETVWTSVEGQSDDIDNYSWEEIVDMGNVGRRDQDYVDDGYADWITEYKLDEYLPDLISDWVTENREDEEFLNDFVDSSEGPSSEAIERYKKEFEDTDPDEYENRAEDGWEYINWCREYVEEEYEDPYTAWLEDIAVEEGELTDEARDQAFGDYTIGEWIESAYGSMSEFCESYGINIDNIIEGGLEEIGVELGDWAREHSFNDSHVETGSYDTTYTDGWAVEDDSSIDGSGTGAEIISPVYDTPKQMLAELQSMFKDCLRQQDVDTNRSTGLHVTMSWNGEAGGYDGPNHAKANRVKMAALLGDLYLLNSFGRKNNSYTKSQEQNVKKAAVKIKQGDKDSLEKMQTILDDGISGDKFSSINFKDERDGSSGYNLIEFRIGGGADYHLEENFNKIVKAVIRYATVMEAGHTDKYESDYAKAVFKLVNNAGKISQADLEKAQDRYDIDKIDTPLINLFKETLSKQHYFDGMGEISRAYQNLNLYAEYTKPNADAIWKKQVAKHEEFTGKKFTLKKEAVEDNPPLPVGMVQPSRVAPSKQAEITLEDAKQFYARALGRLAVDVQLENHRTSINAKAIGIIRNSLKEFGIQESEITEYLLGAVQHLNIPTQNDQLDQQFKVLSSGIDKIFKKELLKSPSFLRAPQIEAVVTGLWNAIHSLKASKDAKELDSIGEKLKKLTFISRKMNASDTMQNREIAWRTAQDKREFNDFYASLTRGGYNASEVLLDKGTAYDQKILIDLNKTLKKYPKYDEPVSPEHSSNIHGDESYIENFLSKYTMKLRKRFVHWQDIKDDQPKLYYDSLKDVAKITKPFIKALTPIENFGKLYLGQTEWKNEEDGTEFLGMNKYRVEALENLISRIEDPGRSVVFDIEKGSNTVASLNSNITDIIRDALNMHYRYKEIHPTLFFGIPNVEKLIKKRFKALKTWMTAFDKIAQKMGFDSQADEIAMKQTPDKAEKNFKKNVRNNNRPRLEIPYQAFTYIKKDFLDSITQSGNARYAMAHKDNFGRRLNKGGNVFVIPAAHWDQANEADEVIKMLNSLKGYPLGNSQEWRRDGCKEIMKAFRFKYGIHLVDLYDDTTYATPDSADLQAMKANNIEIINTDEDSREPHVAPLVPKDEIANPKSKEPFNRSSATMWSLNDHEGTEAEIKRFNAHDWAGWKKEDKEWIYKDMIKNGSFHRSFESFHKRQPEKDTPIRKDDKRQINGPREPLDSKDYEWARRNFDSFNHMMRTGIRKYVKDHAVNQVVEFLTNRGIDTGKKQRILTAIRYNGDNAGLPLTLKDAVTLADTYVPERDGEANHGYSSESALSKFDKLSLSEQLIKLDSIEKNKVDIVHENMGQLPDNNKAKMLNKLLSKPLLASDLQGQFMAYWAVPVPQMISDFRSRKAEGGTNICLRSILRYYIDKNLDPRIKKQIMKEGKDDIVAKIQDLPDDDEQTSKIVSYIEQLLNDMGVGGRLQSLTVELDQINDEEVKKASLKLAKIIASIEMIPLDRAQLFASWKKDTLIDVEKLLSGAGHHFSEVFKGYGTDDYMTEFVDDLAEVQAYGIGAGEFLLAVLSKKVRGIGSTGGSGDLIIDGRSVEVKTKTSKNARFYDDHVKPDQTWASKTTGFKRDFADIEEVASMPASGMNQSQLVGMLKNPKLIQDPALMKKMLRSLLGIFKSLMTNLTEEQYLNLVTVAKSGDVNAFKQTYGAYNITNYLNIKRSNGDLEGILFIDKKTKMMSYVKGLADIRANFVLDVNTIYPISSTIRNPFPQIGLVPK